MDYLLTMDSPVGPVTVASDDEAIIGLWLEGQKYFEATLEAAEERPDLPVLAEARAWLERYFAGDDPGALPPVNPRGTAFQQRVWAQLAEIPYGQLTTARRDTVRPADHVRPDRAPPRGADGSPAPRRAPWAAPSGATPSPSSCRATASWVRPAASPGTPAACRRRSPSCASRAWTWKR